MYQAELGLYRRILPPLSGLYDIGYSALPDGSLAILRSDRDLLKLWQHNLKKGYQDKKILPDGQKGSLFIYDGAIEWPVFEMPLENPFPLLDRSESGNWVFVDSQPGEHRQNAVIYSVSGQVLHRFSLGRFVQHVQYDRQDMIWAGYFDQGFFRKLHYEQDSITITGLLRFSAYGRPLWGTPDPVMDCYALNVSGDRAWVYDFPDFRIMEVSNSGMENIWQSDIRGARALAVHKSYALLGGGYGDEFDRVALVHLDGKKAKTLGRFSLNLQETEELRISYFGGRGAFLHFVWDNIWIRLHVEEVRQWLMQQAGYASSGV